MKELLGHATIVIEPVFSIAPESFDPVEMVPPLRPSFLFPDDHMVAPNRQRRVGLPVVGIVEASRLGVLPHESLDETQLSFPNREGMNDAIALKQTQNDDLAACTPAALSGSVAPKGCLVAFDLTSERLGTLLCDTESMTDQSKESLGRLARGWASEAETVRRNTKHEVFQKLPLGPLRKARSLPDALEGVAESTPTTLETAVLKNPGPMMPTVGTDMLHMARILP